VQAPQTGRIHIHINTYTPNPRHAHRRRLAPPDAMITAPRRAMIRPRQFNLCSPATPAPATHASWQPSAEAAMAASHTRNTYLSANGRQVTASRGNRRALLAVTHSILTAIWHLLTPRGPTSVGGHGK
jgi:hypothetical protein